MRTRKKKFEDKPLIDSTGFVEGVMPPYYEEAEKRVISNILYGIGRENDMPTVFTECRPDWFYIRAHKLIFEACHDLFHESKPIDIISVKAQLMKKNQLDEVGIMALVDFRSELVGSANLKYNIKLIHQAFIARDLIRVANDIKLRGFNPETDPFDLLDFVQAETFSLLETLYKKQAQDFARVTYDNIDELSRRMASTKGVTGIPTGFWLLDEITSGWQKQNLIIIGARPGMGKTAIALYFAMIATKEKYPVAFFSLEMGTNELAFRIQAMESGVEAEKIRSGRVNMDEFCEFRESSLLIKDIPLYIDDTANLSIFELRAKVRRMVHEHGIKMVIIDYLQLMNAGDNFAGNREQEISTISRNLKAIAKDNDIPIIALAQLSRAVETRGKGGSIPILSDLRESGGIENDADIVIFPHRPEYYKEPMMTDGATPSEDMAELHIGKHRNGRTGMVMVRYEKAFVRFAPYHPKAVNPEIVRDIFPKMKPSDRISVEINKAPF